MPPERTLEYQLSGFIEFAGYTGTPPSVIRYSNLTNYRNYSGGEPRALAIQLDGEPDNKAVIKYYENRGKQPLPVFAFSFKNSTYFYYGSFSKPDALLSFISFPSQSIWY